MVVFLGVKEIQFLVSFRPACVAKNILTCRDRLGTGLGTGSGLEFKIRLVDAKLIKCRRG